MTRDAKTMRGALSALVAFALLAGGALPVDARDATREARGERRSSPFNIMVSSTYSMSFNEWTCGLTQIGEVCSSAVGSSVGGGGFWPSGTANQYIFNSGLQVAGIIGADGGTWANDTIGRFFFNASGNGSGQPWPANPGIYASNRAEDLAAWPEDCYIDNPVFGRVKTLSELDTCVQYWDGVPTAPGFSDSHPLGLLVTQHSLLWSFPSNKDIMFFIYRFENVTNRSEFTTRNPEAPAGGFTITNLYAAFAADPDVAGGDYDDNFATVVPDLNLGVAWNTDFLDQTGGFVPYPPNFDAAIGFVGMKFLKSPVNTSDTTMTVRVGAETRTVAPGEELGLTFFSVFTNGGIMSDARNGKQAFRYLSGELSATERTQWCPVAPPGMCYVNLQEADDMRFYQSSGPFELGPGEAAEIVVAYVAGAPVPGTYNMGTRLPVGEVTDTTRAVEAVMGRGYDVPGFPSLFANARTAQAIFDADFVLPSSPRAPNVTVIPGDRQNTVTWDASPVDAQDPYCLLATDPENALFDPNFVCNDFQGFRVYRKSNPASDFELIAQFDLADGIDEQVTVLTEVETATGDILVISADTASVCNVPGCVADTGLKFAIVDRGGSFPNPQNGPGLTNGVRYYYAVTSFDINSPFSGPSSLESARVLSEAASGVPRSTAAGEVAAVISEPQFFGDGNSPLDMDRTVTIDPATGTFSGPQPPTNGLSIDFAVFNPLLLKAGPVQVRIDSIVPLNGYESIRGEHVQTSPNALGASIAYFMTATTPDGVTQVRQEFPAPFGEFGAPSEVSAEVVNAPVGPDLQRAQQLGISAGPLAGAFVAEIEYGPDDLSSGSEAVAANRVHQIGEEGGSRWFSGSEPAEPTIGQAAGALSGVDAIINTAHQYVQNAAVRWLVYLLSPMMRAVDYEVTWGANGEIASVRDVTHNVEVPFSPHYRGSWGVRNEVSGDGIVTFGDFWLTSPVAEWYCETPGCHFDLERTARIQPLSTVPPGGFGLDVASADGTGFGLYIGGELFLFNTATLPASGTTWTLRTYSGEVIKGEDGAYSFEPNDVRPPTVPGLTAKVSVESATEFDIAQADLSRVHTVPDPYYVTSKLETSTAQKKLLFVNLPTEAVIRVYTLSGVLVAALEHSDPTGGGTFEWDLRSRNNQFLASGVYFYHVEAPNGDEKVGKFTIVQYAQ